MKKNSDAHASYNFALRGFHIQLNDSSLIGCSCRWKGNSDSIRSAYICPNWEFSIRQIVADIGHGSKKVVQPTVIKAQFYTSSGLRELFFLAHCHRNFGKLANSDETAFLIAISHADQCWQFTIVYIRSKKSFYSRSMFKWGWKTGRTPEVRTGKRRDWHDQENGSDNVRQHF